MSNLPNHIVISFQAIASIFSGILISATPNSLLNRNRQFQVSAMLNSVFEFRIHLAQLTCIHMYQLENLLHLLSDGI